MRHNYICFTLLLTCALLTFSACGEEASVETVAVTEDKTAASATMTSEMTVDTDEMRSAILGTQLQEASAEDIIPASSSAEEENKTEPYPDSYFIEGVPILEQLPDFPTGCESVSACMLLQYNGYDISPDVFVDEYLIKSDDFYHRHGVCWGPDPYEVFVGDPRDDDSYGCMAPVIADAFDRIFGSSDWGYITECQSLEELCREYICRDIPVMVWVSMDMDPPRPGSSWTLPDGSEYQWLKNEHCMVLVGYNEKYFYFNDPYTGKTKKHTRAVSENRYTAFESQSIVILNE